MATTTTTPTSVPAAPVPQTLIADLRLATSLDRSAAATADLAADVLRRHGPHVLDLPADLGGPDVAADAADPRATVLHAEASFSVTLLVWRPGQRTAIHDHVAWCAFTVLRGVEHETLYRHEGGHLVELGHAASPVGTLSAFAPPGDIHRVHNVGDETAVSLHVYGADLRLAGSSVRRTYDLPVGGAAAGSADESRRSAESAR